MLPVNDVLLATLDFDKSAQRKGIEFYRRHRSHIRLAEDNRSIVHFQVKGSSGHGSYLVTLARKPNRDVTYECTCAEYDRSRTCKHCFASMLFLMLDLQSHDQKSLEELFQCTLEPEQEPPARQPAKMQKPVQEHSWKEFHADPARIYEVVQKLSPFRYYDWTLVQKVSFSDPVLDASGNVFLDFQLPQSAKKILNPQIAFDRKTLFRYRCTCADGNMLCEHVIAAFKRLETEYGKYLFVSFIDRTEDKKQLLEKLGLTPDMPEAAGIKFVITPTGTFDMEVPEWLISDGPQIDKFTRVLGPAQPAAVGNALLLDFEIGFVLNVASDRLRTGFELMLAKVPPGAKSGIKKLDINQPDNRLLLRELPEALSGLVRDLTDEGLKRVLPQATLSRIYSYMDFWTQVQQQPEALQQLKDSYIKLLLQSWDALGAQTYTYLLNKSGFAAKNLEPVKFSPDRVKLAFEVTEDEKLITITLTPEINEQPLSWSAVTLFHDFLFRHNAQLHVPQHETDVKLIAMFASGFVKIPVASRSQAITAIIPELQRKYKVRVPESMQIESADGEPVPQLILQEHEDKFLMLRPQFRYEETVVDFTPHPANILQTLPDGSHRIIRRNEAAEQAFFNELKGLHPVFARQNSNDFFYLRFEDALKNSWFLETVRSLQERGIPVLGITELNRFRFNTNRPKFEMTAGSGIDWFDLKIEVSFGDQSVPLREVRKALLNKQKVVVLGDGTFGVLPEEWLQQYGMLLKMGQEQKDGTLRLNKLHFTLIDELHGQIDDAAVQQEIKEKKERLRNIGAMAMAKPGKKLRAKLRPYQVSGFEWMQSLESLGWGGCLADDMGLGKTLQTITFLQHLKDSRKGVTNLVVCPTSLIYNWENELKKFAPDLRYHIYYGLQRDFGDEHFAENDLIITSYGIVRNDIGRLSDFHWHYVILDESQAIKNPEAQTTKAVQLLKAQNRLVLSGTPVQNNTFDLYAQFQFLNPGLLGNKEFFREEFANPIDRHNDSEKSAQLRRLVYPFLLRRTKGQVATDLPDKTETILWCEMDPAQRRVYEEYKNYYRTKLMEKIAEVGMAKAGVFVLEGLLRLRQICDSPLLLDDSEARVSSSVKIAELLREVRENTGDHKLLVFSQFTGMLELIAAELDLLKIRYCYLDGSTPAAKRRSEVDRFQEDPSVKLFLISLKAGGVGLNLTAADYVYLVDPWWNPAAEQQAIDRTHRIGQTNKIFAYKMICKDSVEEKIIELQDRKKQIAGDLVTEDAGFVKKLTPEDVAFLFS